MRRLSQFLWHECFRINKVVPVMHATGVGGEMFTGESNCQDRAVFESYPMLCFVQVAGTGVAFPVEELAALAQAVLVRGYSSLTIDQLWAPILIEAFLARQIGGCNDWAFRSDRTLPTRR